MSKSSVEHCTTTWPPACASGGGHLPRCAGVRRVRQRPCGRTLLQRVWRRRAGPRSCALARGPHGRARAAEAHTSRRHTGTTAAVRRTPPVCSGAAVPDAVCGRREGTARSRHATERTRASFGRCRVVCSVVSVVMMMVMMMMMMIQDDRAYYYDNEDDNDNDDDDDDMMIMHDDA